VVRFARPERAGPKTRDSGGESTYGGVMSDRTASAVLAEAATVAGFAPSVHNTQPWRWTVSPEALDLFADRSRQLGVSDPEGRLLLLSCGAALQHARVALAAQGWQAEVSRLPDPGDADHLARITLGEHVGVSTAAMRQFQALRLRHTDRRPVTAQRVPPDALEEVRKAAVAEGTDLHLMKPDQVSDLASASARADEIEVMDPEQRTELVYWTGGTRPDGTGVPGTAIPGAPTPTVVPGRDFVRSGTLETGEGHDRQASYAVLFGRGDDPADWLRAGEAMAAAWLTAQELGLSVLPFSAVIEVPATREALRRVLSSVGYPYLVLRLGAPDPDHAGAPHTPRLPAKQTVRLTG
jgi:nitroreductase